MSCESYDYLLFDHLIVHFKNGVFCERLINNMTRIKMADFCKIRHIIPTKFVTLLKIFNFFGATPFLPLTSFELSIIWVNNHIKRMQMAELCTRRIKVSKLYDLYFRRKRVWPTMPNTIVQILKFFQDLSKMLLQENKKGGLVAWNGPKS